MESATILLADDEALLLMSLKAPSLTPIPRPDGNERL